MGNYERKPMHQFDTPTPSREEERKKAEKKRSKLLGYLGVYMLPCVLIIVAIIGLAYSNYHDKTVEVDRTPPTKGLVITPGQIEEPCGGPCGDGLECLDSELQECPCEPGGWVGTICVDYQSTCSCQTKPKKR